MFTGISNGNFKSVMIEDKGLPDLQSGLISGYITTCHDKSCQLSSGLVSMVTDELNSFSFVLLTNIKHITVAVKSLLHNVKYYSGTTCCWRQLSFVLGE